MVERINLLLKAKNITARQFAEEIGIQPSGMSHIMSGRNNPSLDFVMKVDSLANDYDAKRAGQQAFEEMVRIARKAGNRSISRR